MSELLIVPDIHGREFWKKAKEWDGEVICLGDYLDPYSYEGINIDKALEIFDEVLEWAKANPKVHLLYGNHDWHYVYPGFNASRKEVWKWDEIHKIFDENKSLFSRYWFLEGVLFTHAGLGKGWMAGKLNPLRAIRDANPSELFACGPERWGCDEASGPLWLDYHELQGLDWHNDDEIWIDDTVKFQVFGHTQQKETGHIETDGHTWASIDSREVFWMDTEDPSGSLKVWDCGS